MLPARKTVPTIFAATFLVALVGCPQAGLDPNLFNSCDSLQSRPEVQSALASLNAAGQSFTFFSGATPINLVSTWDITSSTLTQTDGGPTNTPLSTGRMSFTPQGNTGTVVWDSTQGNTVSQSIRSFYNGTASGVTACLFAEIRVLDQQGMTTCSTQSAMFLSFIPSSSSDVLTGTFLSVVLESLSGGSPCGAPGTFSFGTMNLRRVNLDIPEIVALGTISLGSGTPTSVAVAPAGTLGYVTFATGSVMRFDTASRTAAFLTLPVPNNFTSVSNANIAPNSGAVGVVTQGDNRLLSYNTGGTTVLEAHVIPPTTPSPGTFVIQPPLYNSVATAGFAGVTFQNQRPGLAMFNPHAGSNQNGITGIASFQQDGLGLMRMSPSTSQVAAVLNAGAPAGLARFVGFINVAGQAPLFTREVDIASATFQSFRDDQLIYGPDNNRVFIANDVNVFSVGSTGNFAVNTVNPRDDNSDVVRHISVSDDNEVLAVTIAAGSTRSNFVLLNPATLAEVHRDRQVGAAVGTTGGSMAIVPGTRIAIVEDGVGNVTCLNTRMPFAAGNTLRAAANSAATDNLGIAVGGRVIAVANRAEKTLYLFRLTNP